MKFWPTQWSWARVFHNTECYKNKYFVCNAPQYIAVRTKLNWNDANAYCEETLGTTLATIRRYIYIYAAIGVGIPYDNGNYHNIENRLYVGINDRDTEGTFKFIDGSSLTYTNWHPGQPNNAYGGQDCGELLGTDKWQDGDCEDERYFVCNLYNIPQFIPTPEPTLATIIETFLVINIVVFLLIFDVIL